jgi:hypothetical protein
MPKKEMPTTNLLVTANFLSKLPALQEPLRCVLYPSSNNRLSAGIRSATANVAMTDVRDSSRSVASVLFYLIT